MKLSGLAQKTALVTGASKGIGLATVKVLAESGVQVICCARSEELMQQTCNDIEQKGGTAIAVKADVTSPSDRKAVFDLAAERFGGVDFLVNNAGTLSEGPSLELSDEGLKNLMEVNFFAMFSFARDAAKQMIERGGGKIINMGSFWGQLGVPRQLAYCSTKAVIESMTRCLAVEWARHNIQVNTVAPGHILTELNREFLSNPEIEKAIVSRIPARRVGDPEDVANMVTFLCSKESDYMTGHIYYVDGGQLIA